MTPPSPCCLNCITAYLHPRYTPRTLIAIRRSKSSGVWSSSVAPGRGVATPGVVEHHVEPAVLRDCSLDRSDDVGLRGDVAVLRERGAAVGFDETHRLLGPVVAHVGATTRAPSAANRSAAARPTPEPAPVMMTVLSCNSTGRLLVDGRTGQAGTATGGAAGSKRKSRSALPRRILYCVRRGQVRRGASWRRRCSRATWCRCAGSRSRPSRCPRR